MEKTKNKVAVSKGYPDWETYENWIIEHNYPVVVAQLLVGAMTEVCEMLQKMAYDEGFNEGAHNGNLTE